MDKINWERIAAVLLTVALGIAAVYCFFRFAFPLLLPFLLAWLLSLCVRPLSARVARQFHLPEKLCAVVLLLLLILLGGWGLWSLTLTLLEQLGGFLNRMLSSGGALDVLEQIRLWLDGVLESLGLSAGHGALLREELYRGLREMLGGTLSAISAKLPEIATSLFSSLPTVFFVVIVTVISGFYFCVDGERVSRRLIELLPAGAKKRLPTIRNACRRLLLRYWRAYATLMGITLLMLWVGFLVLGVEYSFLLALLISLADLLPVIGVGTVMVPWSVVLLLQRNFFTGIGILILYLLVELMRQIMEPKLIGKSLGLHPLLTLFAGYVGFSLFGLWGMIIAPAVALLAKTLVQK